LIKKAETKEMVQDAVEGYGKAIRDLIVSNYNHILAR
jgi:isocitrate dehydrogenase kinase/phosphatase